MFGESNQESLGSHVLARRDLVARFNAGRIASDAGGLVVCETERVTGLIGQLAACFANQRDLDLIGHTVVDSVLGLGEKTDGLIAEIAVELSGAKGQYDDSSNGLGPLQTLT